MEALAWLACSMGMLVYDVWEIRRRIAPPVAAGNSPAGTNDGVWFLGDEAARPVATKNFDLKLKR